MGVKALVFMRALLIAPGPNRRKQTIFMTLEMKAGIAFLPTAWRWLNVTKYEEYVVKKKDHVMNCDI